MSHNRQRQSTSIMVQLWEESSEAMFIISQSFLGEQRSPPSLSSILSEPIAINYHLLLEVLRTDTVMFWLSHQWTIPQYFLLKQNRPRDRKVNWVFFSSFITKNVTTKTS